MTAAFTTDNIDRLQAMPLDRPRGWEVRFRSGNAGLHHQLYVNGRLADFTDTPQQRAFILPEQPAPAALCVAAVAAAKRRTDFGALLPGDAPAWVYCAEIVQNLAHPAGSRVELLTDHATGELDETPAAVRDLWPASSPRWGFGESAFARGGFGYGGVGAPGLGRGAFGAGPFGMNAETVPLTTALAEPGTHEIALRTVSPDGRTVDAEPTAFEAAPPPAPPAGLSAVAYDPQTDTLTLRIEES